MAEGKKLSDPTKGADPKKDQNSSVDDLVKELDSILQESKQQAPAQPADVGEAIHSVEALTDEILGEEEFVGDKSICPSCSAVVDVYTDRCSTCGVVFDQGTCRCANCGAEVPSEAIFCPSCAKPLTESEALCPVCSTNVPYHSTHCPVCGSELAEGEMRCASCGASVEPNAVACPSCGVVLIEGAHPRDRTPAIAGMPAAGGAPVHAVIEGAGGVTEVEVDSRVENRVTVEAILKPPPDKAPNKKAGTSLTRARERRAESLFPFSGIIGQDKMKTALILNVIDPLIGGVLITGQKGTGKSVTVRGLAEITPEISVIDGCRFSCDPAQPNTWCWECTDKYEGMAPESVPTKSRTLRVVDLPLNATEDRVVGTLDVSKVLTEGEFSFESGVLAAANRGVLYVDEVNLLDDYVVDVLLDAAAMGVATVEREGISVRYPARFVMVGSMNPEEGGLRPQLLDRIALQVSVTGIEALDSRMEVVARRMDFEKDPVSFRARFEGEQQKVRDRIRKAREQLPSVVVPPTLFSAIPKITMAFGVDGHRADIMIERGARALAAYEGRTTVESNDLFRISDMVLPHRMRRKPFEQTEFSSERLKRIISDNI